MLLEYRCVSVQFNHTLIFHYCMCFIPKNRVSIENFLVGDMYLLLTVKVYLSNITKL